MFFFCACISLCADEGIDWMDIEIDHQFAQFENGIKLEDINQGEKQYNSCGHMMRYKIIQSQVIGPESSVKETLKEICYEWPVPDVDFLYIFGDCVIDNCKIKAPLLTGAKTKSVRGVILFEDWYTRLCNWEDMANQTNEACLKSPWETKINKLFWRGSGTDNHYTPQNWKRAPRGRLVYLSHKHPELIDAGFFHMHPWHVDNESEFWKIIGKKELIPLEEVPHYKYSIDLDGTTCSYPGLMWKLLMNSVVFKQDSENEMYFYSQLKPWVHYIPVKRNLSDLLDKLSWARKHDEEAQKIAENGRNFALANLMNKQRFLYFYKVLVKYASLQQFTPTPN